MEQGTAATHEEGPINKENRHDEQEQEERIDKRVFRADEEGGEREREHRRHRAVHQRHGEHDGSDQAALQRKRLVVGDIGPAGRRGALGARQPVASMLERFSKGRAQRALVDIGGRLHFHGVLEEVDRDIRYTVDGARSLLHARSACGAGHSRDGIALLHMPLLLLQAPGSARGVQDVYPG